jgi:hypothetical protein
MAAFTIQVAPPTEIGSLAADRLSLAVKRSPVTFLGLAAERWHHRSLRKSRFTVAKALLLVGLTVLDVLMPLVVTGTLSYGEAERVCYNRTYQRVSLMNHAMGNRNWSLKDWADQSLFPIHMYNSIATCVSLVCFLVWFFCSPHMEEAKTAKLDRTRESLSF